MGKEFSLQNSIAVEFSIIGWKASNQTKGKFERVAELDGKKINSIEFVSVSRFSRSPVSNLSLANNTTEKLAHVSFSIDGKEKLQRMPVLTFDPNSNNGNRVVTDDISIDLEKSILQITDLVASADGVFLFIFYYRD